MHRVHGEATECVVFIGRQRGWVGTECVVVFIRRAWTEHAMETRPGVPHSGGNGLVFDRPRLKRDPVHREGSGILQNGGNGLVLERYGRNGGPVDREGCGVPQNGTPRDTVHLHRRPPPASTGSCSSSLHRALLHRLLFNHSSTGTPPPSTVHPALHTTGSCSTTPPRAPLHRLLFIQPSTRRGPVHLEATPPLTVHPTPPQCSLFIQSIGFS